MDDRLYIASAVSSSPDSPVRCHLRPLRHLAPRRPLGRSHPGTLDLTAAGPKSKRTPTARPSRSAISTSNPPNPRIRFALDLAPRTTSSQPATSLAVTDLDSSAEQENSVMGSRPGDGIHGATVPENASAGSGFRPRNAEIQPGRRRSTTKMLRVGQPGLEYKCAPQNRIACSTRPASGIQDHAQHHRIGQFPPRALVHVSKLFGDRQPRGAVACAEPLPQLDQFLSGNRRADFEAHAAVVPIKQVR